MNNFDRLAWNLKEYIINNAEGCSGGSWYERKDFDLGECLDWIIDVKPHLKRTKFRLEGGVCQGLELHVTNEDKVLLITDKDKGNDIYNPFYPLFGLEQVCRDLEDLSKYWKELNAVNSDVKNILSLRSERLLLAILFQWLTQVFAD